MPRYIDADSLCEHLQNKLKTDYEMGLYNHGALTESFIRFVERQPTADVVPRAEVAMEIFEEIERNIYRLETPYQVLHCISMGLLAELKKEYTEGEE